MPSHISQVKLPLPTAARIYYLSVVEKIPMFTCVWVYGQARPQKRGSVSDKRHYAT